jgi:23S rRNA pseudouridine2605 synthase
MCGVASRRGAEKLIKDGRVTLNDDLVEHPGTIIDESRDTVKVDGEVAKPVGKKVYIILNKPRNVLTALSDPFRRRTVAHLTRELKTRVYPIGRLDYDTEGALILTNDGELAYRLAHPKYQIKRVYHALVQGTFTIEDAAKIEKGIELDDGHVGKGTTRPLSSGIKNSKVEIALTEGHKREVKQLFKATGHPVRELRRVEFAGLRVNGIKKGRWRYINRAELDHLKKLVNLE